MGPKLHSSSAWSVRSYVPMTTLHRGRMDEEEQTEGRESSWRGMWRCAAALFQKHLRNAYRTLSRLSGFDFTSPALLVVSSCQRIFCCFNSTQWPVKSNEEVAKFIEHTLQVNTLRKEGCTKPTYTLLYIVSELETTTKKDKLDWSKVVLLGNSTENSAMSGGLRFPF